MSKPVALSSGAVTYAPAQVVNQKKPAYFLHNVCVGSLSGVSAVILVQPMTYFKNVQQAMAAQSALSVKDHTANPRIWFRGLGGCAASFMKALFHKNAFAGLGWRIAIVTVLTTEMPWVQDRLQGKLNARIKE